ncbi:unnamed protein product [Penicillium egyptiacum]|uniref:Zn(2)-C6 fungal-type domain-containing protein n=1 Tax=Penicillium egyptiacum TaxID=1303716 RepID=A0A9W4P5D6_9EURO|nr:unnamed protein product [Penicillium egyptiacum]
MKRQRETRLTRCRTGCMRCRVRRRKCDEGKPRCRNCIDRNFQCQYGPQLTFLTKNARTIQAPDTETPSSSYEAIRFITEETAKDCNQTEDHPLDEAFSRIGTAPQPQQADPNTLGDARDEDVPFWSEPGPHAVEEQNYTSLNDNDESAVAGLLALGMNKPDLGLSDLEVPSPARGTPILPSNFLPQLPFNPQSIQQPPESDLKPISPTETQALLRHYRYEVASWLDICDLGQSFGIQGLQLAMVSSPIRNSILDLSETSFRQLHPQKPAEERSKTSLQQTDSDIQADITYVALLRVIDQVKHCISDINTMWNPERQCDYDLMGALSSHAVGRDINSAIYWLFFRLDLATALATDSDMRMQAPPSFPCFRQVDLVTDPFEMVFFYACRPLWLCARAIQFVHNEEVSPDRPSFHIWIQLVEELQQWYRQRPREFEPMLELEMGDQLAGPEGNFPVILFANGAGLFGNQLYHTAMLILLHNRPRTARVADFHSVAMSPLWHSQRICSIALHNDRRECWDPCLLASFLLAAHRMTHESQQHEVVRGFERIRMVTGWNVNNCLHSLRTEWCLLDET